MWRHDYSDIRICPNCEKEHNLNDYSSAILDAMKNGETFYLFHRCFRCDTYYCDYCALECSVCHDVMCPSCEIQTCDFCHQQICHSCAKTCNHCKTTICKQCGNKCIKCKRYFCPSSSSICQVCENAVCNKHEINCNSCGKVICPGCSKICDTCQTNFCISCAELHFSLPPDPKNGRHLNAQDEIEQLEEMMDKIFTILTTDRQGLYQDTLEKMEELYANEHVPYTCPRCNKKHNPGTRLYSLHKQYLTAQIPIRKLSIPLPLDIINTQIVGSYYTGNQDLLSQIPLQTSLALIAEPDNPHDSQAVSVWYQNNKLGYIPRTQNAPIFQALQNQVELFTNFKGGSQVSRHYKYKTPIFRWYLQVFILNRDKTEQIIKGMQELEVLGYPSSWDGLAELSKEELGQIKAYFQVKHSSSHAYLISKLDDYLLKAPGLYESRIKLYEPKVKARFYDEDDYGFI
ncbi:MAG: HIRAN domain-containing protein [Candidatus Helarchaeota archaeon]